MLPVHAENYQVDAQVEQCFRFQFVNVGPVGEILQTVCCIDF
jgi:hypothetical protein